MISYNNNVNTVFNSKNILGKRQTGLLNLNFNDS